MTCQRLLGNQQVRQSLKTGLVILTLFLLMASFSLGNQAETPSLSPQENPQSTVIEEGSEAEPTTEETPLVTEDETAPSSSPAENPSSPAETEGADTKVTEKQEQESDQTWFLVLIVVLAVLIVPFVLSNQIAKRLRLPEYGVKLGVILFSLIAGSVITWDAVSRGYGPKLGIDLSGGVILIYEIDLTKTAEQLADTTDPNSEDSEDDEGDDNEQLQTGNLSNLLVQQLTRRLNPGGVKEIVIRPYGENQVEIIVPEVEADEVDLIKQKIVTSGYLELLIVANKSDHALLIDEATDPNTKWIRDANNRKIGRWVKVGKEIPDDPSQASEFSVYRGAYPDDILRGTINGQPGQIIELSPEEITQLRSETSPVSLGMVLDARGVTDLEILMVVDPTPELNITGQHLRGATPGYDESLNPCVNFRMTPQGAGLLGSLTGDNMPDEQAGIYRRLGIVMDGELLSAPRLQGRIDSNGQITGNFEQAEVDFLVGILRAGKLPAVLRDVPISESNISAILGQDTIRRGTISIAISLASVLIFMIFYYRFSGIVACLALLTNLLLILSLMILVKAAFTLPGLAGLVLTVGMSVDANVLIFERIREELLRGSALRMAIRNGFARATTTIVDANLTTLITAIVLYAIGTDQIRGFAVTLIFGILMSMYTAIFCSRVLFDIAERKRWISKLGMLRVLGETGIDFIGKRKIAGVLSVTLIIIGLIGVASRGRQIFDIDFNGGTSVQVMLENSEPIGEVRKKLNDNALLDTYNPSVTEVQIQDKPRETIYKIDVSITGEEEEFAEGDKQRSGVEIVQDELLKIFGDNLVRQSMEFSEITTLSAEDDNSVIGSNKKAIDSSRTFGKSPVGLDDKVGYERRGDLPSDKVLALAQQDSTTTDESGSSTPVDPIDETQTSEAEPETEETNEPTKVAVSRSILKFTEKLNGETLLNMINESSLKLLDREDPNVTLLFAEVGEDGKEIFTTWDGESSLRYNQWEVQIALNQPDMEKVLGDIQERFSNMAVWPSSSKVGAKVAGDTQSLAIAALLTSLIGIVAYIWIRFQKVIFGLAAVVALVHDVLITLGALGLSLYLSQIFGFLLIEEFKISLPIVAAFLTIIGYSLNDTIVVFDRIREVKGKSPVLTGEMINTSINQTLGRTFLTSITTLLVVMILYCMGGQAIHGFAFALVVGVLVGTYSSIFIASPVLLWMTSTGKAKADASA